MKAGVTGILSSKKAAGYPVTDIAFVIDPANTTVSSGKIVTFNDYPTATQSDAAKRAAHVPSLAEFKNKPAAYFASPPALADHNFYPLGNLSAFTQGEVFAVLRTRYGQAGDLWSSSEQTGLWHLSGSGLATHYTFDSGDIWDGFGTNNRWTYNNSAGDFLTDVPHILNIRAQAGEYSMWFLDNISFPTLSLVHQFSSGFSVSFPNNAFLGKHSSYAVYFNGWLGLMVLCSKVQTAPARAAMIAYLKTTYLV